MAGTELREPLVQYDALPAEDDSVERGDQTSEGAGRWDWVFVFPVGNTTRDRTHAKQNRGEMVRSLRHARLRVRKAVSRDGDEVLVIVGADRPLLEEFAEAMELELKAKADLGQPTVYKTFTRAEVDAFQGVGDGYLFTSLERIQIIQYIVETKPREGGAGINIGDWLKKKKIIRAFPMHHEPTRKKLLRSWARQWPTTYEQPLEDVKEYFGESIAMYFAWLSFYTKSLIPASLFGVMLFIVQLVKSPDNSVIPLYCVFMAVWATLFLEFWKRQNAEIAFNWDVMDFEEEERSRPEFTGEPTRGYYYNNYFIPDERGRLEYYYEPSQRRGKFAIGTGIITPIVGTIIIATLGIMVFRLFMQRHWSRAFGGIAGGILNAVFIAVANAVYMKVAVKLTDWENHRTDTQYEDALIAKVFLFQFVNSYISLYYIAFLKDNVSIFGVSDECVPNCIQELQTQLASIFITQMVIGQAKEVLIPYLKAKAMMKLEDRKVKKQSGQKVAMAKAERESKLETYPGPFDDYNEMVIQFGYVTLFAAAFPVTSVLALVNNLIEIRSDALKILVSMQRPAYRGAEDIGTWYNILEILGVIAVITNVAIVGFTSKSLDDYATLSLSSKLWGILIAEHCILTLKFIIALVIPDVPESIQKAIAEKQYRLEHQGIVPEEDVFEDWADEGGEDSDVEGVAPLLSGKG